MELRELLNKFADRVELAEMTTRLAVQKDGPYAAIKDLMREMLEVNTTDGGIDVNEEFQVKSLVLVGLIGNMFLANESLDFEKVITSFGMTILQTSQFRREYKRESDDENS